MLATSGPGSRNGTNRWGRRQLAEDHRAHEDGGAEEECGDDPFEHGRQPEPRAETNRVHTGLPYWG